MPPTQIQFKTQEIVTHGKSNCTVVDEYYQRNEVLSRKSALSTILATMKCRVDDSEV